jgi:protein-S-isoprenylcysteine O-methyltransferase Ste14
MSLEINDLHGDILISTGLFAAGLGCFVGFIWAVKAHFRSTGPMPLGMKVVSLLNVAGFGWFVLRLITDRPSSLWPIGLGCFALSMAVFAWAVRSTRNSPPTLAFSTDEPAFLLRHGPYQYVRHPFYVAYLLFWTGTAIASRGWAPWAAPALMLLVYTNAARREEQKFARSSLAAAYRQYRSKVGMFLPHFGSRLTSN